MEEQKPRRRLWIEILVIALLVVLALIVIDFEELLSAFQEVKPERLITGTLLVMGGLVLISVRWYYLLGGDLAFWKAFHTTSISFMIRMFTPIFEPLTRMATVTTATPLTVSQVTPAMMADRLLEAIMRIVSLLLASALVSESRVGPVWVILWVFVFGLLLAGLVRFANNVDAYLPRLTHWLARLPRLDEQKLEGPMDSLGEGLSTVGTARRLVVSLLMSLSMTALFLFGYAEILAATNIDQGFISNLAVAAALLVVIPPPIPAMIGVFQGVVVGVLLPFGFAKADNLVFYGVLLYLSQMVFWVVTGIWGLRVTRLNVSHIVQKLRNKDGQESTEVPPA